MTALPPSPKAHIEGKRVAVKEIFWEEADEEGKQQDFVKELETLKLVSHPNIVRYLGAVQEKPHYCFITEYCEGSVGNFLLMVGKKKVQVTWELLLNIAAGAARALEYMHGLDPQVLHRDIKAENLLLTDQFIVKVTDFGLSRVVYDGNKAKHMTTCGTIQWLAPEVIRGDRYDCAVDVYSYAITMWEVSSR